MRRDTIRTARAGAWLLVGCAGCLAAACASEPAATRTSTTSGADGATTAAKPADKRQDEVARVMAENASVLPSLMQGGTGQPRVDPSPFGPPASPDALAGRPADPHPPEGGPAIRQVAASPEPKPERPAPAAAPETPDQKRRRLVGELALLLKDEAARAPEPFESYAAIGALEMLVPGMLTSPASIPTISPREADLLTVWRDMHVAAGDDARGELGQAAKLTGVVEAAAERMSAWRTLKIARAEICERVEGFGVYTPFAGPKILSGRARRAIVYVELDHFATRPRTGPNGVDGYAVELSQELSLFHDADGLLAWRKPPEDVSDFSRNRRRDFYMVQMIELPANLTVGSYRLKVTIRDKATSAVAESIMPIEVVADPQLVEAQGG